MQRIHINLPDDAHAILRDMCDKEVRNVSSQIQFLIREAHRAKNIKNVQGENRRTVLREEPFVVDGERMMRPLDDGASAGNVIRCRCVMTFDVQGE